MGKSGQSVMLIGVILLLLSFVITPLESYICRSSVQKSGMKFIVGVICGMMGIGSKFILVVLGGTMLVFGLIMSVLPW